MNIPLSTIEPFGFTGVPSTRSHDLMYRRAKRQLEIGESKARHWLSFRVLDGENPNWSDQQLRNYLIAELLHETDWLAVTVSFSRDRIYIYLDHLEYSITRQFAVSR